MNFAIIGCGVIAFTHAKALEALRGEGCVLYGACDIIPEKADAYAAEHGVPHVYYDYHDVLADPAVDIVCVCVPSGTHGEVCKAAAEAGKAIVCEKPMEITPEKIADVIGVVERTHAKMQCIFQRRMMPVAIAVKQAVAEGRFGRICLAGADLKYYRDQAYYNSAGWRGTWEQDGGGALMNQGVHGIDLILWMLGDEVSTLYGRAETLAPHTPVAGTRNCPRHPCGGYRRGRAEYEARRYLRHPGLHHGISGLFVHLLYSRRKGHRRIQRRGHTGVEVPRRGRRASAPRYGRTRGRCGRPDENRQLRPHLPAARYRTGRTRRPFSCHSPAGGRAGRARHLFYLRIHPHGQAHRFLSPRVFPSSL